MEMLEISAAVVVPQIKSWEAGSPYFAKVYLGLRSFGMNWSHIESLWIISDQLNRFKQLVDINNCFLILHEGTLIEWLNLVKFPLVWFFDWLKSHYVVWVGEPD